jgi:hypothetical protein
LVNIISELGSAGEQPSGHGDDLFLVLGTEKRAPKGTGVNLAKTP